MEVKLPVALSKGISVVLHPFLLPLYAVFFLLEADTVFSRFTVSFKLYLIWVVALYALIIPLLMLVVLRSIGRLRNYSLVDRQQRLLPLAIGVVCYALGAVTLSRIPSADLFRKFMLAAAACEGLCLLVTLRWKISLHLTAMGAALAFLLLMGIAGAGQIFVPLVVVVLASGALASARLYLGRHTIWQVAAGFAGGFVVTAVAVLFF